MITTTTYLVRDSTYQQRPTDLLATFLLEGNLGDIHDILPDVRDGLNRKERMVLWVLHKAQKEFAGRSVPTATLYGRVVEHIDMSVDELQTILRRLGAQKR